MENEQRHCIECNEILRGRADQKFCSDACRNSYNNRVHSDTTAFMRNINNILRKNRKILINFFELKKTKVLRETLIQKGFDFNYFTHIYTTKKGTSYYFCYDYGYLILEDGYYFIVKDLNKN
ncbi:MAG: hypothetical protein COX07_00455 [Bacteroidetes bacterium CG23_combo_of_CG06-09_8_20_14_all_32_9]|nr:MAG: hypothetical protein COX07_00455 [Bacteroidetes bacterium CG23_combo_of_CG06-09_8_20_14_all_32_9]